MGREVVGSFSRPGALLLPTSVSWSPPRHTHHRHLAHDEGNPNTTHGQAECVKRRSWSLVKEEQFRSQRGPHWGRTCRPGRLGDKDPWGTGVVSGWGTFPWDTFPWVLWKGSVE